MSKPKFVLMVGIAGSGKSTYAAQLVEEGYIVHASDSIRAEFGDETDQSKNEEVFNLLYKRVKEDLQAGKNVVADATNLRRKHRIHLLHMLQRIPYYKKCIVVATPIEECLSNNVARERQVPEEVILRMLQNFQIPCKAEGWDEIEIVYTKPEYEGYYGDLFAYIEELREYDQGNSHHTLSLGNHMLQAGKWYLSENNWFDDVALAAYMHDIGKPYCRTETNMKGEDDGEIHYYNHHNCGCYLSLFFNMEDWPWIDKKYVALLIELHMRPYLEYKASDAKLWKDTVLFGEKTISDVYKIHDCDLAAH